MKGRSARRIGLVAGFLALAASALTAFGAPANAYGGEQGKLLGKGVGSLYSAGHFAVVSSTTTAGATVTYSLQVKNTGSAPSQYDMYVLQGPFSCAPGCPTPVTVVSAGSLLASPLTGTPNGYYTAPIAPGKVITYLVKVTVPKGTPGSGNVFTYVQLLDTDHNFLDELDFATNVTQTKGTALEDQFVTGAGGQKPVGISPGLETYVTNAAVKIGGTSVFTIKLQNDSAAAGQIHELIFDTTSCAAYFPIKIKAGTIDVTALVLGGTYVTPVLAPGKFVTLTATVTFVATPVGCNNNSDIWVSDNYDSGTGGDVFLVTNPAAS